jgi:NADPH:quinone reductase-like Zn-dependent oxidoreductase
MRAVVFDRFGPPEVLRIADRPDPEPGPGEVRVRVRAAGAQPFDTAFRRGEMSWVPASFPQQIGQEYSGVIDRLGEDAGRGLAVGDEVLGSTMLNAYASLVVVPAATVVRKPAHLDFPTAAGLVAAAQTASGALRDLGVGPDDVLLVHAAAGGVGTVAVQLARLAGATVIGTASPANHDYLRQIGAIPIPYGEGLPTAVRALAGRLPTVALDAAGGVAIAQSVALGIAPERIGTIVDDKSAAEPGARVVRAPRDPARLAEVVELAARGVLTMPIRAYPLADVAEAHTAVESRHGRGKVVLILEP